ncbi:MAG: T9SS type A sorting domain-containing protein [Chitinophagales bacterium]|nr:T9SS type A sorting domain-containing protein [Chitinophagales bacterium]
MNLLKNLLRETSPVCHTLKNASRLAIFLILLGVSNTSFGTVKTHLWEENHRGYSLEEIPGTGVGGTLIEYVAAGTVYENGRVGWHFMHLNENGVILNSRISYSTTEDEQFRVVDITVESANKFWITMQARHISSGSEYDYIYVAGVDQAGNDLPVNPALHITSAPTMVTHRNLYPTHSLYMGDGLFICGYAAENTEFGNSPQESSDKIGMIMKCEVNSTPVTTNYTFWNTHNSYLTLGDFDMALRISPSVGPGMVPDFPLLVTGSVNGYGTGYICGILAMTVRPSGTPLLLDGFLPTAWAYSPQPLRSLGAYGVDMRSVYPDEVEQEGGYSILVNAFDDVDSDPSRKTWGILNIKSDLTVYDPTTNYSFVGVSGAKSWGTQFMDMTFADKALVNGVTVLGQQNDVYGYVGECVTLFDPNNHQAPSQTPNNINPFLAWLGVKGPGIWNHTTGFGSVYNTGYFQPNVVFLSDWGTEANNMNYFDGSLGGGELLEDVTRLYTFGATSHYYYGGGTPSAPLHAPAMVVPIGEYNAQPGSNENLLTKFIKTNNFNETTCNDYYQDCPELFTSTTYNSGVFSGVSHHITISDAYTYFTLVDDLYIPADVDCGTGVFKPTSVSQLPKSTDVEIYPNPAKNAVTVSWNTTSDDDANITITDISGKKVMTTTVKMNDKTVLDVSSLHAGFYMVNVSSDKGSNTQKLIIQ